MREIKKKKEKKTLSFTDIIIVEKIINPRLSEILLHEKYTNSNEIFYANKLVIQISKLYRLFFINVYTMDLHKHLDCSQSTRILFILLQLLTFVTSILFWIFHETFYI